MHLKNSRFGGEIFHLGLFYIKKISSHSLGEGGHGHLGPPGTAIGMTL